MHLVIVTPIFPPAAGGAATYYGLLARALLDNQIVERVTVVTEAFPGEGNDSVLSDGRLRIVRLFPYRAGGSMGKLAQYTRYALQNLHYLRLPMLFNIWRVDAALIHSSFHNQMNLLSPVLATLRGRVNLFADVRDHQLPGAQLHSLEPYRAIIACSDNVAAHLRQHSPLRDRIEPIPIPQEPLQVGDGERHQQAVRDAGLQPGGYLLFAGLLKPGKGIDLLLRSYAAYCATTAQPLELALVGMVKDTVLAHRAAKQPGVRCVGAKPRSQLLELMRFAAVNVNLSSSEGMPRVCLEALALRTRVILPTGIPEFMRYCAPWVSVSNSEPLKLAAQFRWVLDNPPPVGYPIENHYLPHVLPLYAALLQLNATRPIQI